MSNTSDLEDINYEVEYSEIGDKVEATSTQVKEAGAKEPTKGELIAVAFILLFISLIAGAVFKLGGYLIEIIIYIL